MHIDTDNYLADWKSRAEYFQQQIKNAVIGMDRIIELITIAVFARGHVMLEGDVGVGKTTLLRAVARGIGGAYERIEGTIDLMPNDLIYHTYINQDGKPRVDPGPILKHGGDLSTFFFNEVNRARPQVHSLLLRVMAEKSITAFNQEFHFPHLQVFADRNRVEKEETFEIPSAARDRFMMELHVETTQDPELRKQLMFNPRFHDVDRLMQQVEQGVLSFTELNELNRCLQERIEASPTLQNYALSLWEATGHPKQFGIALDQVDMDNLVLNGASARGMGMLFRAARISAWLSGRDHLLPDDIQNVFKETISHRIFLTPAYELRRSHVIPPLVENILNQIAAP